MAAYGEAKAILFRGLPSDGCAVLNADDPFSATLRGASRCPALLYGLRPDADLSAVVRREERRGIAVDICWRGETASVFLPLHGRHGVANALAACGAALSTGRTFADLVPHLETLPPVPGRWETFTRDDGLDAVVDYAHTPDGLAQVLGALRPLVPDARRRVRLRRRQRPRQTRARWARSPAATPTSSSSRPTTPSTRIPRDIAAEIARGVARTPARCLRVLDRNEAIAAAVAAAAPGGVVLLAGKGHETYQIVRGEFVPHSDVEALQALGFRPLAASRAP